MLAIQYHNVWVESAQALKDLVSFLLSPILLAIHASILKFLHYHSQFLVHLQGPQSSALQHLPQALLLLPQLVQGFATKDTGSVNSKSTSCLIVCSLKLIGSNCCTTVREIHIVPPQRSCISFINNTRSIKVNFKHRKRSFIEMRRNCHSFLPHVFFARL